MILRRLLLLCRVGYRRPQVVRGLFRLADERENKPPRRDAPVVKPADRPMGPALRSVYQRTVEEAIPPEMLDLLSKLD